MMLQSCRFECKRHGYQQQDIHGARVGVAVLQMPDVGNNIGIFKQGW